MKLLGILICDFLAHYIGYLGGLDLRTRLHQRNMVQTLFDIFSVKKLLGLYFYISEQNVFWIWRNFKQLKYLANGGNGDYNNDNYDDNNNGEDNDDRKNIA